MLRLARQFSAIAIMGPRQSGKTTLAKQIFSQYKYVTLEDIDKREEAKLDPRKFFATYANEYGIIIDEIQEVPELLSYMQGIIDQEYKPGYFVIICSQHFLAHEKISQTLAGRIALLTLLPLTIDELQQANMVPDRLEAVLFKGLYPRLYAQTIDIQIWFANYIATYVERDVRLVLNISDVVSFQRFIKLCAARIGNILNYASLARDCDISPNTAKAWLSVLEASYIIKLVHPYYKNFNKRVIKSPKIYFYDTGLVCSLLNIKQAEELYVHPLRGAIFESFVISELFKQHYNQNIKPEIYFWRDVQGHEIDCVIEKSLDRVIPLEIKSGRTITKSYFAELADWRHITGKIEPAYVIYAGNTTIQRTEADVVPWNAIAQLISQIYKK